MVDHDMWEKIDPDTFKQHELKRPSLTYLKDAFRRLRKNTLAMISLVFLIIMIISVIVIPMFWKYSYSDQNTDFQSIGPTFKIYAIGDGQYFYVNNDKNIIMTSGEGKLLYKPAEQLKNGKDRITTYSDGDTNILVDWGIKIDLEIAYKKLISEGAPAEEIEAARLKFENSPLYLVYINDMVNPVTQTKDVYNQSYIFGTDQLGRDLFVRIFYGGRISLIVAISAAIINLIIGVTYGGISGYIGGKVDNLMMRFVDIISTIPLILYVIVLMVVFSPSIGTIILALSLTYWVGMARIVRGQVLSLREQEFVLAAKIIGAKTPRILFRHIVPNTMGPIMVSLTMQIPGAIFTEAFLSFIGVGIPGPIPSWGSLASEGRDQVMLGSASYLIIFPVIVMSITLLAFNLLGDGLRDALDPRLRK